MGPTNPARRPSKKTPDPLPQPARHTTSVAPNERSAVQFRGPGGLRCGCQSLGELKDFLLELAQPMAWR